MATSAIGTFRTPRISPDRSQ